MAGRSRFGPAEARRFYDRFGARQDRQGFYEDAALDRLVAVSRMDAARDLLEIGCGTGRFAHRLLDEVLPSHCRYLGVDLSATMVELARARLAGWEDRAAVRLVEGGRTPLPVEPASVDRVVTTYVFDLLEADDLAWTLSECHRVLRPGGLLCHAGIAPGRGPLSRLVSGGWAALHRLRPGLVGGCRPFLLAEVLPAGRWSVEHQERLSRFGVTSEVVVARRHPAPATGS